MKKLSVLLLLFLALFCVIDQSLSYFNSTTSLFSTFFSNKYEFKLSGNGGSFNNENVIIKNGETILPTPYWTGYQFQGYSKTLSGPIEYSQNIPNVNDINNKMLYAKWTKIEYSISYSLNGGNLSTQKINYTVEDSFTLPTPTKQGYQFLGWTGSNGNIPQQTLTIKKGTTGNLNYVANWKINTFIVDVNPVIQNAVQNAGLSGFTFSVYLNDKLILDHGIDYYSNSIPYNSKFRVVVHSRDGYNIKSFTDKTYVVTSNLTISPSWYDDIPPTITSFNVTNLGLYDPVAGVKKGWNVNIYIDAFDQGTGILKYQTWLAPYGSGSGASRVDGNYRELRNVLYLEEGSGRTFCAYAIDVAGNEASKCETIRVS